MVKASIPVTVNLYTSSARDVRQSTDFTIDLGSKLYIRIEEKPDSSIFKFVVERCWTTPSSEPNDVTRDVMFERMCPIDDTVRFTDKTSPSPYFDLTAQSFFFEKQRDAKIYLHCELLICLSDDNNVECIQKNAQQCKSSRKRRSVGDNNENRHRIITSQQIRLTYVEKPRCTGDQVFDSVKRICSTRNLVEIKGLRLEVKWDDDYLNTSSKLFKDLVRQTEDQLYTLVHATEPNIVGVKVLSTRKGSVVLTLRITHTDALDAKTAFERFKIAVTRPSRVGKLMKIRHDIDMEYVVVDTASASDNFDVTLVVVVVAMAFVIMSLVLVVWKMRRRQRHASSTKKPDSYDNPTLEMS